MIPSITLEDPLIAMSPSRTWDTQTFFPHFSSYVYNLCSDKESIVFATNAVLNDFMEDGVVYLELRTTPRVSFEVKTEEYVDTILGCIEKFASRDKMSTYLILSIDRRNTYEQAMAVVDLAIQYKHRRVVGIDLCGDPSKGDVSIFKKAFAKAKKHGLKITLHFAEIPESSTREELETLFCFEPDRLGHVIHVPNDLKQEIVRRTIGVELCVSCNVQSKMTEGNVAGHHFGWWHRSGCPVILCVSDIGRFCYLPISSWKLTLRWN